MKYLVPFISLKKSIKLVSNRGSLRVDIGYDEFLVLVRKLLLCVDVDETWYRKTYPDVDEGIRNGTFRDAKTHFVMEGYQEGRRPFPLEVDEQFYLRENPDVKMGIETGEILSVNDHFDKHGYEEGRLPAELPK